MNKDQVAVGQRVALRDQGLAELRQIMKQATGVEPEPNHHGTVKEIWEDSALVFFDDGGSAPCSFDELEPLADERSAE